MKRLSAFFSTLAINFCAKRAENSIYLKKQVQKLSVIGEQLSVERKKKSKTDYW